MTANQTLAEMKLVELKELAKKMGIRGISGMRKPELINALSALKTQNNHGNDAKNTAEEQKTIHAVENHHYANNRRQTAHHHDTEGIEKLDLGITLPTRKEKHYALRRTELELTEEQKKKSDAILSALPDRSHHHTDIEENKETTATRTTAHDDKNHSDRFTRWHQDTSHDEERRRLRTRHTTKEHRTHDRHEDTNPPVSLKEEPREIVEEHEPEVQCVPVAGIVDILDSYAFIRTSGYLPGLNDVYVSMGLVKKYGLRKGDAVQGTIKAPHDNDRRVQRQKFVPLQSITTINGMTVEEAKQRPQFSKLTPLYPQERLRMETEPTKFVGRLIDIVSPIGKGQRGLIVAPPKAGKTVTLQNIANAITTNNPECHLMVVLVDERPEEVTDMQRTVHGEVISSTFDRPASDHTIVAELAIERAKRLVELGQDVVVLLDSITRLARAYNISSPASGKVLSGGIDAQALYPPKKFFGAARNVENGGSLTIIATALVETGSKMDEVIFEEFKGTGNMELRLSRELAEKRLFPAIDINSSGTRREELITSPAQLAIAYRLRRLLGGMDVEQAYQTLVPRLKKTSTNNEFLTAIAQNISVPKTNS